MPSDSKLDPRPEHVYTAAVRHYLHQDRIFWELVRLVFILQVAAIGGSLTLVPTGRPMAVALLLGVAIWTSYMVLLAKKTERDRDVNLEMMDFLAERLVGSPLKEELINHVQREKIMKFPCIIRWTRPDRPWWLPTGATFYYRTLYGLIGVDVVLALWFASVGRLFGDALGSV